MQAGGAPNRRPTAAAGCQRLGAAHQVSILPVRRPFGISAAAEAKQSAQHGLQRRIRCRLLRPGSAVAADWLRVTVSVTGNQEYLLQLLQGVAQLLQFVRERSIQQARVSNQLPSA